MPTSPNQNNSTTTTITQKRNSTDSTSTTTSTETLISPNPATNKPHSPKIKELLSIDVSQPTKRIVPEKQTPNTKQLIQSKINKTVDAVIESTLKLESNQKLNSPAQKSPSPGTYQNGELYLANNDWVKFLVLTKDNEDYSFLFPRQNEPTPKLKESVKVPSTSTNTNKSSTKCLNASEELEINRLNSQLKELQDQKQQQFKRLSYLNEDLNNHMSRKLDPSDNFLAENLSPPNLSQSQNQELIYALNILNQSDKTDECKSKF